MELSRAAALTRRPTTGRRLASRAATGAGVLLATLVLFVLAAGPAAADPAKPSNYESKVLAVRPATDALSVEVVGGDGFLDLSVARGHRVVVQGYSGEAWLRILPDGTVEENQRSPATYLDVSRYITDITVPASADPKAPPSWKVVGHDGHFVWHDHRIHWMNPGEAPPMVPGTDRVRMSNRADGHWVVPASVDGHATKVVGELLRHPSPGPSTSLAVIGAIILLAVAASVALRGTRTRLLASVALVVVAAGAAVFAGWEQLRVVPREAGGSYLVVLLPAAAVVLGVAALVLRGAVSRCLTVLIAVACVLAWGLYQLETLWMAVPLSALPHDAARVLMAAVLGVALGAAVLAVRSGALAMPAAVPVHGDGEVDDAGDRLDDERHDDDTLSGDGLRDPGRSDDGRSDDGGVPERR